MNNDMPLIPVSFRGDTWYLGQHQGEPYVPMRPVVEGACVANVSASASPGAASSAGR